MQRKKIKKHTHKNEKKMTQTAVQGLSERGEHGSRAQRRPSTLAKGACHAARVPGAARWGRVDYPPL